MTAARPRLRVDRTGLWIRNVFGEPFTPWQLVVRVAYPQGAPWAQLMMPDDEVKPVMAIQAMDRGRAVQALEEVRALQATVRPAAAASTAAGGPPGRRIRRARWAGWRSSTGRRPRARDRDLRRQGGEAGPQGRQADRRPL